MSPDGDTPNYHFTFGPTSKVCFKLVWQLDRNTARDSAWPYEWETLQQYLTSQSGIVKLHTVEKSGPLSLL